MVSQVSYQCERLTRTMGASDEPKAMSFARLGIGCCATTVLSAKAAAIKVFMSILSMVSPHDHRSLKLRESILFYMTSIDLGAIDAPNSYIYNLSRVSEYDASYM